MSGPPKGVPAWATFEKLCEAPRPTKLVDFPRKVDGQVFQVRLRVLTLGEQFSAMAEADAYCKKLLKDAQRKDEANFAYDDTYKNACSVELLYRAVLRPAEDEEGVDHPFFPSPMLMRQQMTGDDLGVLMNEYLAFQAESGPIVSRMSEEEVEEWILRIQEGGRSAPFASLSLEGWTELVMHLVSRLPKSSTATSSSGSQPDDTSTT